MNRRTLLCLTATLLGAGATSESAAAPLHEPARRRYQRALDALAVDRVRMAEAFEASAAPARREIAIKARKKLLHAFDDAVFPAWAGTAWDYNGTTTEPGQGTIACGYFVTTVMLHLGFKVERARLAQQASERIVKALCPDKQIWRFRKGDTDAVATAVTARGAGLYVVGLDNHVGFLRVQGDSIRFCHASYVDPAKVRSEVPQRSAAFASNYHVVGRLFSSSMLRRWLARESFATPT